MGSLVLFQVTGMNYSQIRIVFGDRVGYYQIEIKIELHCTYIFFFCSADLSLQVKVSISTKKKKLNLERKKRNKNEMLCFVNLIFRTKKNKRKKQINFSSAANIVQIDCFFEIRCYSVLFLFFCF